MNIVNTLSARTYAVAFLRDVGDELINKQQEMVLINDEEYHLMLQNIQTFILLWSHVVGSFMII